jgi:hypothetical protein
MPVSQRTEPREVFERFGGHPILCATDFPDTVKAVLNPGATEIDGRILHLYDGVVDTEVRVVGASRARSPKHLAQPPDPADSPSAPAGRTKGTA